MCSYCYLGLDDDQWPAVFRKALRPGGVVVFQAATGKRVTPAEQAVRWKGFQLLRVADLDAVQDESNGYAGGAQGVGG